VPPLAACKGRWQEVRGISGQIASINYSDSFGFASFGSKQLPCADTVEKMEALLPWNMNIEQAP